MGSGSLIETRQVHGCESPTSYLIATVHCDCSFFLQSLASRPDSCRREFTPSSIRMWQKPTSCTHAYVNYFPCNGEQTQLAPFLASLEIYKMPHQQNRQESRGVPG